MRVSVRFPSHTADAGPDTSHGAPSAVGGFPAPREVLGEIGLVLASHLAAAFGITVILRLFGIA